MNVVDLFAGCGGLSLGFERAGYEILSAFENWDAAIRCYEKNFSHPIIKMDLSDTKKAIKAVKQLNPEIIIGGPPCQDFSHAGKRIENERAELTECFAKIVAGVKPQAFVMENVDRAQHSNSYKKAREILKKAGYGLNVVHLRKERGSFALV